LVCLMEPLTFHNDLINLLQLRTTQRRLQIRHSKIMPCNLVPITNAKHSVIAIEVKFVVQLLVGTDHHSPFARGDGFGRVETKRAEISSGAGVTAVEVG